LPMPGPRVFFHATAGGPQGRFDSGGENRCCGAGKERGCQKNGPVKCSSLNAPESPKFESWKNHRSIYLQRGNSVHEQAASAFCGMKNCAKKMPSGASAESTRARGYPPGWPALMKHPPASRQGAGPLFLAINPDFFLSQSGGSDVNRSFYNTSSCTGRPPPITRDIAVFRKQLTAGAKFSLNINVPNLLSPGPIKLGSIWSITKVPSEGAR